MWEDEEEEGEEVLNYRNLYQQKGHCRYWVINTVDAAFGEFNAAKSYMMVRFCWHKDHA